jgi:hypothetical protein
MDKNVTFDGLRKDGTLQAFIEQMRLIEQGYFERLIEDAKGDPKEQIKRFFDEKEIFGKKLHSEEMESVTFEDYDWDSILKQPDVNSLINAMELHFQALFASVTLKANDKGLHVEKWNSLLAEEYDKFLGKLLEDGYTVSPDDIRQTVQSGEPVLRVKNTYYFFEQEPPKFVLKGDTDRDR